jgi:CheY-like chemotaxis protein
MLAFARRQELKPEAVDVVRHINGITDMLRRTLGPPVEIAFEPEDGLSPITVDPNQLELAVLNLALNARDAMPNGGRLTIAARRALPPMPNLQNLPPGDYVCVSVTDTGVGMEEAILKRAAEPFFTTKGPSQGTGLGLSMVFGLAAQSGGLAQISSKLGVGTTVAIWFPVAGAVSPDRPAVAAPLVSAGTAALNVLLVEDDPMVAESTAFMLEHLGHRVVAASSGVQALDLLGSEPDIDLVITDNAMAGMTGIELSERIRQVSPGLPVILATGYTELPTGRELGLPRLNKPYRLDKLSALLGELAEARRIPRRQRERPVLASRSC